MISSNSSLVSVVIPTYNHAHFLGRALRSVLAQSHANWEAIVIDNHSTDNTDDVVLGFGDPRISLLKIHNNGVIAASRNMGIRSARGEWIAFLDSDDLWYPQKLALALKSIEEDPSLDVCSTDELMVDESTGNRRLLKYGPSSTTFYNSLLLTGNCLSPSATLVNRGFLVANKLLFRENREFITVEDYDFWMLLARSGARFRFIHSVQGEYTVHAANSSGQIERHIQSGINVLKDHVYQMQSFQPDKDRLWRRINARLLLGKAKALLADRQVGPGLGMLMLAFRSSISGSLLYLVGKLSKSIRNFSA